MTSKRIDPRLFPDYGNRKIVDRCMGELDTHGVSRREFLALASVSARRPVQLSPLPQSRGPSHVAPWERSRQTPRAHLPVSTSRRPTQ